jgi:Mrp family chromosome partitioning ATPase
MGRHATVLERAEPRFNLSSQVLLEGAEKPSGAAAAITAPELPEDAVYTQLAVSLFDAATPQKVVAFASAQRGEGVTFVVRGLAAALTRLGKSVAVFNGALRPLSLAGVPTMGQELADRTRIAGVPAAPEVVAKASDILGAARGAHQCVLVDCGSLETSVDVVRLSPICDGVVLVVEASRASKRQVMRATSTIRHGGGTLAGLVLNKRQYPIPGWLYKLL